MLVDQLRVAVTTEQDTEIIEPCDDPLQLYPVHEENGQRCLGFAHVVEEGILQTLLAFGCHVFCPVFQVLFVAEHGLLVPCLELVSQRRIKLVVGT